MQTKTLWRKYRRTIFKWADYALYACDTVCTLMLLWLLFNKQIKFKKDENKNYKSYICGSNCHGMCYQRIQCQ